MENSQASLLLSGENFQRNRTSLHDLLQAYEAFEGIIDCTYANATGVERFTDSERRQYQIVIRETKDNSWDTFLDIVMAASPFLFGNSLTPIDLLATARATFEFLKCVFKLKNADQKYTISNDANGNVSVNTENGVQFNFHAPVSINLGSNARDILPEVNKFIGLISKGALDKIELHDQNHGEILELSAADKNTFSVQEKVGNERYEFEGEIYRYNKHSRTGRLQVKELQELPKGNYTFRVFDRNIQDDVIISMIKRTTPITARPIVIDDPVSNQEVIQYLEVLDV